MAVLVWINHSKVCPFGSMIPQPLTMACEFRRPLSRTLVYAAVRLGCIAIPYSSTHFPVQPVAAVTPLGGGIEDSAEHECCQLLTYER